MSTLEAVLLPQVGAVIQDCVNQLAVLGGVTPQANKDGGESTKLLVGDSIGQAVEKQHQLEAEYDRLLTAREELQRRGVAMEPPGPRHGQEDGGFLSFRSAKDIQPPFAKLEENQRMIDNIAHRMKQSTQDLVTNMRQNPSAAENMVKIHSERQHVQDLMATMLDELDSDGTFTTLVKSVSDEVLEKERFVETIMREEDSRERVQTLEHSREEIHAEKEERIVQLDETIFQLRDQLQETKARVALEGKYIKKEADVRVTVAAKRSAQTIDELAIQSDELRRLTAEEMKCHKEVTQFLEENFTALNGKLEKWTTKGDVDTDQKQRELDNLKEARRLDLDKLTKKTDEYSDYQKVCQNDQKRRARQRKQAQQAVRDMAAAVKVQAWWRGMLVRHKLGPFKKKGGKKGKGKKGKKKK